jgi:hypothetical protein
MGEVCAVVALLAEDNDILLVEDDNVLLVEDDDLDMGTEV